MSDDDDYPVLLIIRTFLHLGNPYSEVIDFEDMDALSINNDAKTSEESKETEKKEQSGVKRPALVVQQLPPPMMLPP